MRRFVLALGVLLLALGTTVPATAQLPPTLAWSSSVLRTLRANIRDPEPRTPGLQVELAMVIDAKGQLAKHWLHTRSGSASWDQAVLDAAARASVFPPPPPGVQTPFRLLLVVRSD
jgi:TonB family protein